MSQPSRSRLHGSIPLLDGAHIPWLGWGNGSGDARRTALESGSEVLRVGIRHIDTAQNYRNEANTGKVIAKSDVEKDELWVTSKISERPSPDSKNPKDGVPVPLAEVRTSIDESLTKLGFIPDLFLIHCPYVAEDQEASLKKLWEILEDLKDEGKLKSIGVSNFRPQDLNVILEGARHKPVVNQLEYHPYVLAHLEPVLAIQKEHGIVTEAYGSLTPTIRHPTGGPLQPILLRIAQRLNKDNVSLIRASSAVDPGFVSAPFDPSAVLLLWVRAMGVVAVTASGNRGRIRRLAEISYLPDGLLNPEEVQEISDVGKTVHWRYYTEHMEKDFPLPQLPTGL
ncbi:NADP-dependent oxidoreductase domain-containing protein [Armillaria novae-zelandiae]|uniref:NADP-dependent oxidoreductase domain-containing protein n=1 Tax=Armillaria novae-zelandiae TaxID=153914 RepID=A0AA39PNU4_9AGAR|nr:NADP-dependent oxidoreductase domain-containing protein [Armillaria novae-zelandiae]